MYASRIEGGEDDENVVKVAAVWAYARSIDTQDMAAQDAATDLFDGLYRRLAAGEDPDLGDLFAR